MKTTLKRKNDEFLFTCLKNVLSLMGLVNHPRTPKLWTIAHENGHKRKYDEFFGHASQTLLSVIDLVNHSGTPKLWAIAHENGPKTQKR
jgi:hypothetical protein